MMQTHASPHPALVLMVALLSAGCRNGGADKDPGRTSLADDGPPLAQAFEDASAGIERGEARAPRRALRWAPPPCELEYAFATEVDLEVLGEERHRIPTSGLTMSGSWTARAAGERMLLDSGPVSLAHHEAGTRYPGTTAPAGTLAQIRLETDGRRWTELEGPTSLWSAYGTPTGLVLFFPGLPRRTRVGRSGDWHMRYYGDGAGQRAEIARGSLEVPPDFEPHDPEDLEHELDWEVEVVDWLVLGGTRALVVQGAASLSENTGFFPRTQARRDYRGHWVIGEDGVLLHANLRSVTEFEIHMGDQSMHQRHTQRSEARLVRGCPGQVVFPPFAKDASPTERALAAIVEIRELALEGEESAIAAHLSPALLDAHPRAPRCIIETVAVYGALALGIPELPNPQNLHEQSGEIHIEVRGQLPPAEEQPPSGGAPDSKPGRPVFSEAEYTFVGPDILLRSLSIRESREEPALLSLSTDEMQVTVDCQPSD